MFSLFSSDVYEVFDLNQEILNIKQEFDAEELNDDSIAANAFDEDEEEEDVDVEDLNDFKVTTEEYPEPFRFFAESCLCQFWFISFISFCCFLIWFLESNY